MVNVPEPFYVGFLQLKCSLLEYSILWLQGLLFKEKERGQEGVGRMGGLFSSGPVEQEAWSTRDHFDLRLSLRDYPLISAAKARLRSASN